MCTGAYRSFQAFDGSCICAPRYEFYDQTLLLSEDDSPIDCQPKVYDRCPTGEVRTANGQCVSTTDFCAAQCPGVGGEFRTTLGLCECNSNVNPDQVCDATCRAQELQLVVNGSTVAVVDPLGNNSYSVNSVLITGLVGHMNCPTGAACRMRPMQATGNGNKGVYAPPVSYVNYLLQNSSTVAFSGRRLLQSTRCPALTTPLSV